MLALLSIIAQDACSIVEAKDCALVIGVTYFLSALLRCLYDHNGNHYAQPEDNNSYNSRPLSIPSLVLKNLVGRRFLMLVSALGMAVAQVGHTVIYCDTKKEGI